MGLFLPLWPYPDGVKSTPKITIYAYNIFLLASQHGSFYMYADHIVILEVHLPLGTYLKTPIFTSKNTTSNYIGYMVVTGEKIINSWLWCVFDRVKVFIAIFDTGIS